MRRSRHGFTLIELLVVIAIIAILAAILFPTITKARLKSQQSVCTSNMRQLMIAVKIFVQDNDNRFPNKDTAWGDLALPAKFLRCPTKGEKAPNGYGYNASITDRSVSDTYLPEPPSILVMADSDNAKNLLVRGNDLSKRHFNQAICGWWDGHVTAEKGTPSFIYPPVTLGTSIFSGIDWDAVNAADGRILCMVGNAATAKAAVVGIAANQISSAAEKTRYAAIPYGYVADPANWGGITNAYNTAFLSGVTHAPASAMPFTQTARNLVDSYSAATLVAPNNAMIGKVNAWRRTFAASIGPIYPTAGWTRRMQWTAAASMAGTPNIALGTAAGIRADYSYNFAETISRSKIGSSQRAITIRGAKVDRRLGVIEGDLFKPETEEATQGWTLFLPDMEISRLGCYYTNPTAPRADAPTNSPNPAPWPANGYMVYQTNNTTYINNPPDDGLIVTVYDITNKKLAEFSWKLVGTWAYTANNTSPTNISNGLRWRFMMNGTAAKADVPVALYTPPGAGGAVPTTLYVPQAVRFAGDGTVVTTGMWSWGPVGSYSTAALQSTRNPSNTAYDNGCGAINVGVNLISDFSPMTLTLKYTPPDLSDSETPEYTCILTPKSGNTDFSFMKTVNSPAEANANPLKPARIAISMGRNANGLLFGPAVTFNMSNSPPMFGTS